jgi:hypothetical protein
LAATTFHGEASDRRDQRELRAQSRVDCRIVDELFYRRSFAQQLELSADRLPVKRHRTTGQHSRDAQQRELPNDLHAVKP